MVCISGHAIGRATASLNWILALALPRHANSFPQAEDFQIISPDKRGFSNHLFAFISVHLRFRFCCGCVAPGFSEVQAEL